MDKVENKGLIDEKLDELKITMPDLFKDGLLDKEKIIDLFIKDYSDEKFGLNWFGKVNSIRNILRPSECTLIPQIKKSVNWNENDNMYIEGDNLEVLKCLQKTYSKKVKFIYIDPPYNTGTDFVYKDDFKNSFDYYLKVTSQENRANPETNGRFHSDWLNMIYPRLYIAHTLLRDDGVIAISIDDHEMHNLKFICDEIFGDSNCLGVIPRITKKSGKAHSDGLAKNHDYILMYAKNIFECELNGIDSDDSGFNFSDEFEKERGKYKLNQTLDYDSLWYNTTMDFGIEVDGITYYPGGDYQKHIDRHNGIHNPKDWVWRWSKAKFDFGYKNGFVVIKEGKDRPRIYTKTYLNAKIGKDSKGKYCIEYVPRENNLSSLHFVENEYSNDNAKKELDRIMDASLFDFPKPVSLIKSLIKLVDSKDMIVMDFFSGSATTAQAVLEMNKDGNNRKFILVQLPEKLDEDSKAFKELNLSNLCELGEYRIKQYLSKEETSENLFSQDVKKTGFNVFKLERTNIRLWDSENKVDEDNIFDLGETIKEGRSSLDVAYEVMLKYGLFNMKLERIVINSKEMFSVGSNFMILHLSNHIKESDVQEIGKLGPKCVVFKESGFENDNDKLNAVKTLETFGVQDIKCL